jgi:integral membrane sensor domain MASE1
MHGLVLRRVELTWLSRIRLAVAVLILGAAFAGAAILYWHRFEHSCAPPDSLVLCRSLRKPGWVDPTALAICLLGVVGASEVLLTARRSNR